MGARRLLSTVAVSLAAQIASLVAVLALTPLQLEAMGAQRYALVSLSAGIASYVIFFDIGGGWAVMRYVPLLRHEQAAQIGR